MQPPTQGAISQLGSQASGLPLALNNKIAFLSHRMGISGTIYMLYLKVLTQRNFVAEFYRQNISFVRKTAKLRF